MDSLLEERNILLFGHIVAAVLLLGPLTAAASRFPAVALGSQDGQGTVAVAAELHRTTKTYGSAAVVVPILGLVLTARGDLWTATWVQVSLGLLVGGAALLFAVIIPTQTSLLERLRTKPSDELERADVARLRASTGIMALSWVVIAALMVAKPS